MQAEYGQYRNINIKHRPWGRVGLISYALVGLLLAGCASAQVKAKQSADLSAYDVARFCDNPQPPMGLLNPGLSRAEEIELMNLVYETEGLENFPQHPSARQMYMNTNVAPVVSPDEKNIAYASTANQITIMSRRGENLTRLSLPPTNAFDIAPSWSTDGQNLVFERRFPFEWRSEVLTVSIKGGEAQVTTTPARIWNERPRYLASGRIIFSERDDGVANDQGFVSAYELYTINPDGSDKQHIKLDESPLHTVRYFLLSDDRTKVLIESSNNAMYFSNSLGIEESETVHSLSIFDSITGRVEKIDEITEGFVNPAWRGDDTYVRYDLDLNIGQKKLLVSVDGGKRYDCLPPSPDELF